MLRLLNTPIAIVLYIITQTHTLICFQFVLSIGFTFVIYIHNCSSFFFIYLARRSFQTNAWQDFWYFGTECCKWWWTENHCAKKIHKGPNYGIVYINIHIFNFFFICLALLNVSCSLSRVLTLIAGLMYNAAFCKTSICGHLNSCICLKNSTFYW